MDYNQFIYYVKACGWVCNKWVNYIRCSLV